MPAAFTLKRVIVGALGVYVVMVAYKIGVYTASHRWWDMVVSLSFCAGIAVYAWILYRITRVDELDRRADDARRAEEARFLAAVEAARRQMQERQRHHGS